MAVAALEPIGTPLEFIRSELLAYGQNLAEHHLLLTKLDVLQALGEIEAISKIVDHLQIVVARAVRDHDTASTGEKEASGSLIVRAEQSLHKSQEASPVDAAGSASTGADQRQEGSSLSAFKTCAEFLRARLGISRSEANRRLRVAADILPDVAIGGNVTPAPMSTLGAAAGAGEISGRAVSIVQDAVQRVRSFATPAQLESMERHLATHAAESDEDLLRVLARRWEGVLDQDGQEPTEKVLKARQGVFLKGRRNGLHFLEIGATDEQFEHMITVMNTATNPRSISVSSKDGADPEELHDRMSDPAGGSAGDHGDGNDDTVSDPDRPTRAQLLLDGLVSGCRIALSTDALPAAGGHRPQVMVTISYADLVGEMERAGHAVFGQQISARSIRRLACDADIIPLVLGGQGQILDIGRAQRLFPAHLRRALVARDKGCAFPDCSIPATWCEAHHIVPWARGGTTGISDGVLLCSRHHHVIHEGNWTVESQRGVPWFSPPAYLDPNRRPRRNRFWTVEEAVKEQLIADERPISAGSRRRT